MGYAPEPEITPAQKLHLDFETHTAAVRAFVERHFGRDSLPGAPVVTVADLILSDAVPEELAHTRARGPGIRRSRRARCCNLRHIGGEAERRTLFARLAILACDVLSQRPDPDMALNNWERFLHALPDPHAHLRQMLSQPMRLEILLSIFSASQFLADTLVRDPALLDSIGRPEVIQRAALERRDRGGAAGDLGDARPTATSGGTPCGGSAAGRSCASARATSASGTPTQRIMEELSDLADGGHLGGPGAGSARRRTAGAAAARRWLLRRSRSASSAAGS